MMNAAGNSSHWLQALPAWCSGASIGVRQDPYIIEDPDTVVTAEDGHPIGPWVVRCSVAKTWRRRTRCPRRKHFVPLWRANAVRVLEYPEIVASIGRART